MATGGRSLDRWRLSDSWSLSARRRCTFTQYTSRLSGSRMARRSNGAKPRSHAITPGERRRARSAASSISNWVVMRGVWFSRRHGALTHSARTGGVRSPTATAELCVSALPRDPDRTRRHRRARPAPPGPRRDRPSSRRVPSCPHHKDDGWGRCVGCDQPRVRISDRARWWGCRPWKSSCFPGVEPCRRGR